MDQRPPWERDEDNDLDLGLPPPKPRPSPGDPTEGVRIIGAEEAAEAIEKGSVAGRRGEGLPRYGDRPDPPSGDVRPALRFPLPTADAGDVPRPRVSGSPGTTPLPPWTDPPTGEVPRILEDSPTEAGADDDLEVWSSFSTGGPRWRDQPNDWDEPDYDDVGLLHDAGTRVGALDDRPGLDPDDPFGFDATEEEPVAPLEPPQPRVVRTGLQSPPQSLPRRQPLREPTTVTTGSNPSLGSDNDRDIRIAVAVGLGLFIAAVVLFAIGPGAAMVIVTGVVVLCAVELFSALQRGGYQPATLLGLVATGALVLATYWKGETAIPLVLGLTTVATLLWYLVGVTRLQPTMNAAVSMFGVLYVGLLGCFAALILTFPDGHGTGVLMAVIIAVVANDVGALLVGRQFGRARLAPDISPNKTVEGLIGGTIATVVVAAVIGGFGWEPWDFGSGVALGIVVAVMAPLGDLCESMLKRDLGVKDMGAVLPGHGGVLDRFDALLFCLPATYYLCRLLDVF